MQEGFIAGAIVEDMAAFETVRVDVRDPGRGGTVIEASGDGHIAANDPGSSLASRMRQVVITLDKRGYLADPFGGAGA